MVINFIVIQFVPGGPVEQMIAQLTGDDVAATARFGGGTTQEAGDTSQRPDIGSESTSRYTGAQGLTPDLILEIE